MWPDDVSLELIKVLIQLIWSDDERDEHEVEYVRRVALALNTPFAIRAAMERWLNDQEPLPPPDLARLKPHRQAVMNFARSLAEANGHVDEHETWLLDELAALLS